MNYAKGTLALAHNGNLINANELREELSQTGAIFQTTIDSETIVYFIARERLNTRSVEEAVARAVRRLKGAYSLVVMSPRKLIAARDPTVSNRCVLESGRIPTWWPRRPVPWTPSALPLSRMCSRERS